MKTPCRWILFILWTISTPLLPYSSQAQLCGFCYLNPTTNRSEFSMLAYSSEEMSVNLRSAFRFSQGIRLLKTRVLTIDKDFNEISVLKEVFPEATILLYVLLGKYLNSLHVYDQFVIN